LRCQKTDDGGQMAEDPSPLSELGASPCGLQSHKTPWHADVRYRRAEDISQMTDFKP